LTMGTWPPNMRTAPIWSRTRKVSRMLLPLNSLKLSAQSPPWRTKARPMAASARRSSRWRASPAKTTGGNVSMVSSTASSASWLGYSGSCSAFFAFQLSTAHFPAGAGFFSGAATVGAAVFAAAGPLFFDGSAAWAAAMERLFMGTNAGRVWAAATPDTAAAAAAAAELVASSIAVGLGGWMGLVVGREESCGARRSPLGKWRWRACRYLSAGGAGWWILGAHTGRMAGSE
jgi:hypothetical protein